MKLISKSNKWFRFLLCAIDIYSKYAWVVPLKDKKSTNTVQNILDESGHKPSKIWVDKGSEFFNISMKSWLENNNTGMCSTHNEGKSVVTERFIRTLNKRIHKCIISISKTVYIDKLDDIVKKYNNIYDSTSKIKPIDV